MDDPETEKENQPPARLQTPFAFIDTEAIRNAGLDWNNRTWTSLAELSRKAVLRPLTTSITIREVEARIDECVSEIEDKEKSLTRVYRRLGEKEPNTPESPADRLDRLKKAFGDYRQQAGFQEIPLDCDIERVLKAYFTKSAPFGPSKKKDEFPDAIVLDSLTEWMKNGGNKVYIISRDKDMKSYCEGDERLVALDTVGELLSRALASAELSAELETAVATSKSFARIVKDGLKSFKPHRSSVELDHIDFTDIEVEGVYLIDELEDTGEYILEVEASAYMDAEAREITEEIVPDRNGDPDLQQFYHQRSVDASIALLLEVVLQRIDEDPSSELEVTDAQITTRSVEVRLPQGFSSKIIKLSKR